MATGRFFPLDAFEGAIRDDADVLGVLYTGSLGRGAADRFSDLDIELWVTDHAFADALDVLGRVMSYLGAVQFMYRRGEAHVTGFVGPDWQRVDLVLHRQGDLHPEEEYAGARVVKDSNGALERLVSLVPEEVAEPSWEEARAAIEEAIDSQIYLSLHNARGAVWSAMGEVGDRAAALYTVLASLRGHESFGFRYVENVLSPEEQAMLGDAWPAAPEPVEVRRAARALWDWTRHVWREAEAALGRSLEIRIDEEGLLAAIERIYSLEPSFGFDER